MNELLEQLNTSHITLDESDILLKHPRYCELLRRKPEICNQEKRRNDWLENIKRKRQNELNSTRGLVLTETVRTLDQRKKAYELREYRGWLMLSEWLIDVPSDINENWLCSICPEGTRALVVAELGKTAAYKRNGRSLCPQFQSWLPGGSKYTNRGKTVLDTIFHRSSKTFFILDIIYWGVDTTDFEAQLRFYWLESKFQENSKLRDECASYNKYKFTLLEHFPFSELKEKMKVHPVFPGNNPKVDGILFYHREGTYVQNRSPLVTWLNPFMLPDILKMDVSPEYLLEKPPTYSEVAMET